MQTVKLRVLQMNGRRVYLYSRSLLSCITYFADHLSHFKPIHWTTSQRQLIMTHPASKNSAATGSNNVTLTQIQKEHPKIKLNGNKQASASNSRCAYNGHMS